MRKIYNCARLDEYLKAASEADPETAVAAYFSDLPSVAARYRENTPLPARELRLAAEAFVKAEFQTGNLAPLGIGEEGVVLTDGEMVYKYFPLLEIPRQGAQDSVSADAGRQVWRLRNAAEHYRIPRARGSRRRRLSIRSGRAIRRRAAKRRHAETASGMSGRRNRLPQHPPKQPSRHARRRLAAYRFRGGH